MCIEETKASSVKHIRMRELQLLVRHGQGYSAIRESSGAAIYSLHPIESSLQSLAWRFCAKASLLSNDSDQIPPAYSALHSRVS